MLNPDYKEMLSFLIEEKVEFILVGAYALAAHGFPRAYSGPRFPDSHLRWWRSRKWSLL